MTAIKWTRTVQRPPEKVHFKLMTSESKDEDGLSTFIGEATRQDLLDACEAVDIHRLCRCDNDQYRLRCLAAETLLRQYIRMTGGTLTDVVNHKARVIAHLRTEAHDE